MIDKTLVNLTHRILALTTVAGAVVAFVGIILIFATGAVPAG